MFVVLAFSLIYIVFALVNLLSLKHKYVGGSWKDAVRDTNIQVLVIGLFMAVLTFVERAVAK